MKMTRPDATPLEGRTQSDTGSIGNSSQLAPAETASLEHYLRAASSDNTRKAYRSAIRQFERWGGRLPSHAHELVRYLIEQAPRLNTRTLDLHLTAIGQWHRYQGLYNPVDEPLVRKTMEGMRRTHGTKKQKATPLRLEHIAQMLGFLKSLPESNKKARDTALILVAYFGAFRRSELTSISAEHVRWENEGLIIHLPRSKTDQHGSGIERALPHSNKPTCPVCALKAWMLKANITHGPVFRPINRWDQVLENALNGGAINALLKNLGRACQFEFADQLSSHSFRRGLSTSAARANVDFALIKKQGGWKHDATVWEYIEEGRRFVDNAAAPLMNLLDDMLAKK